MPFSYIEQDFDMLNSIIVEFDNIDLLNEYILNIKTTSLDIEEWDALINKYINKLIQISNDAHIHFKSLLPTKKLKLKINSSRFARKKKFL
jgi:hypothetical protein